jgi:hypothetical protein
MRDDVQAPGHGLDHLDVTHVRARDAQRLVEQQPQLELQLRVFQQVVAGEACAQRVRDFLRREDAIVRAAANDGIGHAVVLGGRAIQDDHGAATPLHAVRAFRPVVGKGRKDYGERALSIDPCSRGEKVVDRMLRSALRPTGESATRAPSYITMLLPGGEK